MECPLCRKSMIIRKWNRMGAAMFYRLECHCCHHHETMRIGL